ncbi:MAG: hypothetical protein JOZ41_21965 [Chloroflexi bacterium]|nr:hypothetical protein [Chloroflexota bacterium]
MVRVLVILTLFIAAGTVALLLVEAFGATPGNHRITLGLVLLLTAAFISLHGLAGGGTISREEAWLNAALSLVGTIVFLVAYYQTWRVVIPTGGEPVFSPTDGTWPDWASLLAAVPIVLTLPGFALLVEILTRHSAARERDRIEHQHS